MGAHPLAGAALCALCLVVYLAGMRGIPPVDRDESRFAQASRQMLESVTLPPQERDPVLHSGGLVVPKVQGRDRLNKPPLIYWAQAASAWAFTGGDARRDAIWMYRVPSVLAALAGVLLTWRLGASMFGARAGLLAGALLAVCPIVAWEAHQARADMVLLAFTTLAMLALWRVRERAAAGGRTAPWALAFWAALGLGILTKGPVTPLVAALTAGALCLARREARWVLALRPALGVVVVAAIVGPWVYLVGERVGWETYLRTIVDETLGRSVSAREGHWGPPGYHTVLLPILFWPGSLLTAVGLARATKAWRATGAERGGGADLFCLAWIVPSWIVFELVGTKLPHYTLPLYPAVAILTARAVVEGAAVTWGQRIGAGVWFAIGLAFCLGLPAGLWWFGVRDSAWIIALGVVWLGAVAWWLAACLRATRGADWGRLHVASIAAAAATGVFLMQAALPGAKRLWLSMRAMEFVRAIDPAGERAMAAVGYHEDSLVFLTRGRVERIDEADAEGWFSANPGGLMILPTRGVLESHTVHAQFHGFNYSKGRVTRLSIVSLAGAP